MTTKELQEAIIAIVGDEDNIWTVLKRVYDKGSKDTLEALRVSGTLSAGQTADFKFNK